MRTLLTKPLRKLVRADFIALVAVAMLVPYYSTYVEKIGGDLLDAGVGAGVFALCAAAASLFAGIRADKIKHKSRFVAAGYLGLAIGFFAMIFVQNVWQLMIVQGFIGIVSASYQPAFDALFTQYIGTNKKAGSRWAVWESANYISIAAGAIAGAIIVKQAGFSGLFMSMALMCAIAVLYIYTFRYKIR